MNRFYAILPFLLSAPAAAFGALSASAVIAPSGAGPAFHYSASVNNTGTTDVGTFWYAWVPGEDFLATSPANITSPAGWTAQITHFPATSSNGYAIQWVANTTADDIHAGSSLSGFGFDSTDTSSQLQGDSVFYPGTPVGTSFVYSGNPFSDAGFQFVAMTVPEPATLALLASPLALLLRRRR